MKQFCRLFKRTQVKAKNNKVHRNTQRKLDQLAKADPELAAKAIAKVIPVDAF